MTNIIVSKNYNSLAHRPSDLHDSFIAVAELVQNPDHVVLALQDEKAGMSPWIINLAPLGLSHHISAICCAIANDNNNVGGPPVNRRSSRKAKSNAPDDVFKVLAGQGIGIGMNDRGGIATLMVYDLTRIADDDTSLPAVQVAFTPDNSPNSNLALRQLHLDLHKNIHAGTIYP